LELTANAKLFPVFNYFAKLFIFLLVSDDCNGQECICGQSNGADEKVDYC
jgi:hypothetical protein